MSVSDGSVERAKSQDKRQLFPWLAHSSPSLGRNNQVLKDMLINHGKALHTKRELSACGKDRCQDENMRLTARDTQDSCRDTEIIMLRNKQVADALEIDRLKEQIKTLLGSQKNNEGEDVILTGQDDNVIIGNIARCNGKQEVVEESVGLSGKINEKQEEEKVSLEGQEGDTGQKEIKISGETNQDKQQLVEKTNISCTETVNISEIPLGNPLNLQERLLNDQQIQSKGEIHLDGNVSSMIDSILQELTLEALGITKPLDDVPSQPQISCDPSESTKEGTNINQDIEKSVKNQEEQLNYQLKYTELLNKFEQTEQFYDSLRKQDHQENEKLSRQIITLESKLSLANMRNAALVQDKSSLLNKLAETELKEENQHKKYAEIVGKIKLELKRISERLEVITKRKTERNGIFIVLYVFLFEFLLLIYSFLFFFFKQKECELLESNEKKLQCSSKLIEYSEVLSEYRDRLQESERQLEEQRQSINEPIQNINMVFNIIANYKQTLQHLQMEIVQLIGEHKRQDNEKQGDLQGQLKRKNEQLSECCRMLKESKERMSKVMRENSLQNRVIRKIKYSDVKLEYLLEEEEITWINGLKNKFYNSDSSSKQEVGLYIASARGKQRGNRIYEGVNITSNVDQYVDYNNSDNLTGMMKQKECLNKGEQSILEVKQDQQLQKFSQGIQEINKSLDDIVEKQV